MLYRKYGKKFLPRTFRKLKGLSSAGSSLTEYAFLLSLIGLSVIISVFYFGKTLRDGFNTADLALSQNAPIVAGRDQPALPPGDESVLPPEDAEPFLLTIRVSASDQNMDFRFTGGGNGVIDWDDGSAPESISGADGSLTHTYSSAGTYQISFTGSLDYFGVPEGLRCSGSEYSYNQKLVSLDSFGTTEPTHLECAFSGAGTGFVSVAPLPSSVTDLTCVLCWTEAVPEGFSEWDVSNVSVFDFAIAENDTFNEDITSWDMSSATSLFAMFHLSSAFNQPIGSWDVSNVENMSALFFSASSFNQPIGSWDTSSVTTMASMFRNNEVFDQDLSSWNTSSVTNTARMFAVARSFNHPVENWDVSKVTTFDWMFHEADAFVQDISTWDVSSAVSMSFMFRNTPFSPNIESWNVSGVENFSNMFAGNTGFNRDISGWNMISAENISGMFRETAVFNQDISSWNILNIENLGSMFFGSTAFNQDLSAWEDKANATLCSDPANYSFFDFSTPQWTLPKPDYETVCGS